MLSVFSCTKDRPCSFGDPYAQSGNPALSFTGQNQDTAANLYDFPYREYGIQGRWVSPDPLGPGAFNLADPQSLDRYAYVRNSPMSFVDPYGFCGEPDVWGNEYHESIPFDFWYCSVGNGAGSTVGQNHDAYDKGMGGSAGPGHGPDPPHKAQTQKQKNCAKGLQEANKDQSAVERAGLNWGVLEDAGQAYGINPAMLAAIGVRESGFRDMNEIGGGPGVGIFQITVTSSSRATASMANDPSRAALYAAGLLSENMAYLANKFPNFTPRQLLQATAASYNFGVGNISGNPATIDWGTAPGGPKGNYGSDILLLMDCF
jgi:RHS repeat-associated protein